MRRACPACCFPPMSSCLGGEKGKHFLGDSEGRQAQSWARCRQGKQQGEVALPKFLLQAPRAHEAPAPLGLSSHTHLITIAGLGNKVLFNSESIWQPGRAGSAGCQPQQLPRADPVRWQHGGRGPCHSTPRLGTRLSHANSAHTCLWCQQSLCAWAGHKGWVFSSCSMKWFPETGVAFPILGVAGDTVMSSPWCPGTPWHLWPQCT